MRHHRDSPPRTISPSISPTERFPSSSYTERPRSLPPDRLPVEEYEIRLDSGPEFNFDVIALNMEPAPGTKPALPPKPARSDVYRFDPCNVGAFPGDPQLDPSALNVASFAAAIASDTAHLTRMSVSPLEFDPSRPLSESFLEPSLSPTANMMGAQELPDPTPKTIDYQNSRRQKGKPPSPGTSGTDWSPISDLSPILDVSPSVERVEQENMIPGRRAMSSEPARGAPGGRNTQQQPSATAVVDPNFGRRVLPNAPAAQHSITSGIPQQVPMDNAAGVVDQQGYRAASSTAVQRVNEGYRASSRGGQATADVMIPESSISAAEEERLMRSSLKRCPNFENISIISSSSDISVLQSMTKHETEPTRYELEQQRAMNDHRQLTDEQAASCDASRDVENSRATIQQQQQQQQAHPQQQQHQQQASRKDQGSSHQQHSAESSEPTSDVSKATAVTYCTIADTLRSAPETTQQPSAAETSNQAQAAARDGSRAPTEARTKPEVPSKPSPAAVESGRVRRQLPSTDVVVTDKVKIGPTRSNEVECDSKPDETIGVTSNVNVSLFKSN